MAGQPALVGEENIEKGGGRKLYRLQNGNISNLEGRKTSVPLIIAKWKNSLLERKLQCYTTRSKSQSKLRKLVKAKVIVMLSVKA